MFDPAFKVDKYQMPRLIPFILYLTFWAILYIANTHYAEGTLISINKMNKELKELRADYLTIKADLMFRSKQSEVAKMVESQGINELDEPPKKIYTEE